MFKKAASQGRQKEGQGRCHGEVLAQRCCHKEHVRHDLFANQGRHMTCSCGNAPCEPQAQPSPHEKCLCPRRLAGSRPGPARGDEPAMAQKAKAAKQPGAAKKQGQPAKQPGTPAKQRGKPATRRKKNLPAACTQAARRRMDIVDTMSAVAVLPSQRQRPRRSTSSRKSLISIDASMMSAGISTLILSLPAKSRR